MKRHKEALARIAAAPDEVFAHLDDQTRLAVHISKPSLIMGGGALRVWIDYEPPTRGLGRFVPALGDTYARWCVDQMVGDAVLAFGCLTDGARDSRTDG